jgi:carbon starvation protein CstA
MDKLASDIGEKTMFGRVGGAPTFAVGMAQMFARAVISVERFARFIIGCITAARAAGD